MDNRILPNIKKLLGLDESYTAFDTDIVIHINSAFSTLNQLGIGPSQGFSIEDNTATWDTFLGDDKRKNDAKTYIYIKVRLVFDPPQTSFAIDSLEKVARELEWRLNVLREGDEWDDPYPSIPDDLVFDGGSP